MTSEEFELAVRKWEKIMEDIAIEMNSVTNDDGFVCYYNHQFLVDQFNTDVGILRQRRSTGQVRPGLKVS